MKRTIVAAGIVMLEWRARLFGDRVRAPLPPDELRVPIGYEEIVGGHHTPAELRRVVEKVVQRASCIQ